MVGLFARLTDPAAFETLAGTSADMVMIDVEHGSFDRQSLSQCVLASQSNGLAVLIRVCDGALPAIQHAVGIGADGIVVPHVADAGGIADIARFIRSTAIERAYAGATRVSHLRREPWATFRQRIGPDLLLIAQIDEPAGVSAAAQIVATPGVDAIFLGRIGLTLAMEAEGGMTAVDEALEYVCETARSHGLLIGLSLTDASRAAFWQEQGVSLFVIDSDHAILSRSAEERLLHYRDLL